MTSPLLITVLVSILFSMIVHSENQTLAVISCYLLGFVALVFYQRLKQLDRYKISLSSWLIGQPSYKAKLENSLSVLQGLLKLDVTDDILVTIESNNHDWGITITNNSFRLIGRLIISKDALIKLIAPEATPNSYTRQFSKKIDKLETKLLFPKRSQTFSVTKIYGFQPSTDEVLASFLYLGKVFNVPYPYFPQNYKVKVKLNTGLKIEVPATLNLLQETKKPITASSKLFTIDFLKKLNLPVTILDWEINPIDKMIALDLTHMACLIPFSQKKNEFGRFAWFNYNLYIQGEKLSCTVDLGSKETSEHIRLYLAERSEDFSNDYVKRITISLLQKDEIQSTYNNLDIQAFPIKVHRKGW